ncbi:MAG TPA: LON peptidase substrate-binding domain-containing protein [Candidatus Binatia bacterium]|nr:LON peptidase substrate-binding domain-containing protein [Candidatus Binatia bacterium]
MTPLFPLPDVVFFPKTLLPLHVYEPRYRALASEALEQDRIICTALLKPGWESDYYGSPEVYPVGCLGKIVQHQKLPDGRYNITLDGIAKVSIESSVRLEPYRLVRVKAMEDDAAWARSQGAVEEAAELMQLFREVHEGQAPSILLAEMLGQEMTPESILNTVALNLNAEPGVKEQLLEMDRLDLRYQAVLQILRNATKTQERIERVRHLYPRDKRIN